MTSVNGPSEARPTRRGIAKGAAWAAPAMVLASQAPAMASSNAPDENLSINGWIYLNWDDVEHSNYGCIRGGTIRLTSPEPRSYYPDSEQDDGLWVDHATVNTTIENAKITFWIKVDDVQEYPLDWRPYTTYGQNYGWSRPTYKGTRRDSRGINFALYELSFHGSTKLVGERLYLVGNIGWYASFRNADSYGYTNCPNDIIGCLHRDVDITYKHGDKPQHRHFKRCISYQRGLLPSSDKLPRRNGRRIARVTDGTAY
ncbi:hypothetical protein ACUH94_02095 [Dermabacteraceae bacterium P7074]